MADAAVASSLIESFKKPVPSHPPKRTNTACRQCRKRKLKCDARRPCSTCLRSHAYLVDHPLPGVPPPPEYPECIYEHTFNDDGDEDESSEGRQKLVNRIKELEALIRDMAVETQTFNSSPPSLVPSNGTSHRSSPKTPPDDVYAATLSQTLHNIPQKMRIAEPAAATEFSVDSAGLEGGFSWLATAHSTDSFSLTLANDTADSHGSVNGHYAQPGHDVASHMSSSSTTTTGTYDNIDPSTFFDSAFTAASSGDVFSSQFANTSAMMTTSAPLDTFDFQEHSITHTGWSPNLPDPATTRRLVQAFFAFHIHAGRLFHGPSFLASLDLHPLNERFPSVAVLHALCSVGSTFVAEIVPTPVHTHSSFPYVIFHGRWRRVASRPDSFAEHHAKLAKYAVNQLLESGEHIISTLQAQVLLSWFYIEQARWSESFMNIGAAIRNCIPLGLTNCYPFKIPTNGDISGPVIQTTAILPETDDVIEQETRRNIFWLIYAMERQCSMSSGFALELDDLDINQLLPVRGDQFELGTKVPMEKRQFSNDRNVLTYHPPQHTDSFTLYIKAAMVLSRVKTFNTRFKGRYHAGDPALYSPSTAIPTSLEDLDPRDTPAFQEVDELVTSWTSSFPPQFRAPIQDETVDPHLYYVLIAGHLAILLLHDPHMDINNPMCPSANKTLNAARGILDLIYLISSTTYNVSLLDSICVSAWFFAGRVLIRFLYAAIRHNYVEHIIILHNEVSYIYSMLSKAGERVPAAYRSKRLLFDVLVQTCGEQFADPPAEGSPNTYIAPAESALVDRTPSRNLFGLSASATTVEYA